MIRSGFASNSQGPTFFLPPGKVRNEVLTDKFLIDNGAVYGSTVVMTPNGYLTDEAWLVIVPLLIKGLRQVVTDYAASIGINEDDANELIIGLTFDGFKTHVKNLVQLINMSNSNILAVVEGRDSSEINQPFDRFVAKAGKRRASITLDAIRRSHITPVIDHWTLVLVGLQMLRDATTSDVWMNSFLATNMHPHYRLSLDDWLQKIHPFVEAADKFETEVVDMVALLPAEWRKQPLTRRQQWINIIDEDGASWDVDLIAKLRGAGMNLSILINMFKIYNAEKRILEQLSSNHASTPKKSLNTERKENMKDKGKMFYHLFNPKVEGMSPLDKFKHAVTVRNHIYGPKKATVVSPFLDVEVTPDNEKFLRLTNEDVNMHNVLQQSTCKKGKRRRVAKRCLNALGGVSGFCGFMNGPEQLREMKLNLKFAESVEEVKNAENELKLLKAEKKRQHYYAMARKKCKLKPTEKFVKSHASKLTIEQIKAVAFLDCGGIKMAGKLSNMREKLSFILPDDLGVPDYETQDAHVYESGCDSGNDTGYTTESDIIKFDDLFIGDKVEVYWPAEHSWFEGEIKDVDLVDKQFEVAYKDNTKFWHEYQDFPVRSI